jgi:hypothetical protein
MLTAINKHITSTQTAYIKGRSITDNLRLLSALNRLVDSEENIDATIIALDAQKAFDSVSHKYIEQVLTAVGLSNFVTIFQLLYKNLVNDIMINGQIGTGYEIKNGVKQGDALSCSLFILAIEPVLRNIKKNERIENINSVRLNYAWPKLVAYADDITVITKNKADCINEIFTEYARLTRASGLRLNADKTEKYDIYSHNIANPAAAIDVNYLGLTHTLRSQQRIKLNGLILECDRAEMQKSNYDIMLGKMTRHFKDWSKRALSLLGKIQIIKTFGISQYLYTVAVIELAPEQWKTISKELHKFLWNKQYEGNAAPHRIRKSIMYTSILNGGFGMIELADIAKAARLKRYAYLLEHKIHPIADLQLALGGKENLKSRPVLDIDDVTTSAMKMLREYQIRAYGTIAIEDADVDLVLH